MPGFVTSLARRIFALFTPWPRHPIDNLYDIETSRRVAGLFVGTGNNDADRENAGYVGSQPSIARNAIEALPDVRGAHFFDLGCGKGRILAVAEEYPFAKVTGIELVPRIARVARRNMAKVLAARGHGPLFEVITGDATSPALPSRGTAVLFLSNPFRATLFSRLMNHLEASLNAAPDLRVFLIYYNPTQVALVDGSPAFARFYAARPQFAPEELATSPFGNDRDSIVVWQSRSSRMTPALPCANREVKVTTPDWAAHVQV